MWHNGIESKHPLFRMAKAYDEAMCGQSFVWKVKNQNGIAEEWLLPPHKVAYCREQHVYAVQWEEGKTVALPFDDVMVTGNGEWIEKKYVGVEVTLSVDDAKHGEFEIPNGFRSLETGSYFGRSFYKGTLVDLVAWLKTPKGELK